MRTWRDSWFTQGVADGAVLLFRFLLFVGVKTLGCQERQSTAQSLRAGQEHAYSSRQRSAGAGKDAALALQAAGALFQAGISPAGWAGSCSLTGGASKSAAGRPLRAVHHRAAGGTTRSCMLLT